MNEFFCPKCLISMYSAISKPNECLTCGSLILINPERSIKENLIKLQKVIIVDYDKPKEE